MDTFFTLHCDVTILDNVENVGMSSNEHCVETTFENQTLS